MKKFKSAPDKRRRLTQREESAVGLIALRMVIAEREWNPGDAPVVRMLDMMFRALEYQIAAKAFGAWLTRLGIQTLRRGGRKLVVVPVSFDEAESALRKLTGAGHTLATAVKASILEQACKLVNEGVFAGVGVDSDTHKTFVVEPGHDYRSQATGVICSGLRMGQAPCVSAEGQNVQGGCGGSIPSRSNQAGSEPARQHQDSPEGGDATEHRTGVSVARGPHAAPAEPRKPLNDFLDEEED